MSPRKPIKPSVARTHRLSRLQGERRAESAERRAERGERREQRAEAARPRLTFEHGVVVHNDRHHPNVRQVPDGCAPTKQLQPDRPAVRQQGPRPAAGDEPHRREQGGDAVERRTREGGGRGGPPACAADDVLLVQPLLARRVETAVVDLVVVALGQQVHVPVVLLVHPQHPMHDRDVAPLQRCRARVLSGCRARGGCSGSACERRGGAKRRQAIGECASKARAGATQVLAVEQRTTE